MVIMTSNPTTDTTIMTIIKISNLKTIMIKDVTGVIVIIAFPIETVSGVAATIAVVVMR